MGIHLNALTDPMRCLLRTPRPDRQEKFRIANILEAANSGQRLMVRGVRGNCDTVELSAIRNLPVVF